MVGAPWIDDPAGLAAALNARGLAGVRFEPIAYMPSASIYSGQPLGGIRLMVTEREAFRPVATGLAVARELMERYPAHFQPAAIQNLLVNRATIWTLLLRSPLARIWSWAEAERASFLQRRASYLMY